MEPSEKGQPTGVSDTSGEAGSLSSPLSIDPPVPGPANRDEAWKHYGIHIAVYQHHLDLLLRFNIFYYAITGAILSLYLSNNLPDETLWFPAALSIAASIFCFYCLRLVRIMQDELERVRQALGMPAAPQFGALRGGLITSTTLFGVVAVGLLSLLIGAG